MRLKLNFISKHLLKILLYFIYDVISLLLSFIISHALINNGEINTLSTNPYYLIMFSIYIVLLIISKTYSVIWIHSGTKEFVRLGLGILLGDILTVLINKFCFLSLNTSLITLQGLIIVLLVGGMRFTLRSFYVYRIINNSDKINKKLNSVMIVGAGDAGKYSLSLFNKGQHLIGKPVMFVDDDIHKVGMRIMDIPVLGSTKDIPKLAKIHNIKSVIIAIPSLTENRKVEILSLCNKANCKVKIFSLPQSLDANIKFAQIKDIEISDFLPRNEVSMDIKLIKKYLENKTILVTGGGGSIGSELCRQIMDFKPKLLIVFDIYENCAYELQCELKDKYGYNIPVIVLIGSIRDKARVDKVMQQYHPDVVFNAAAHKHVPLMEGNPIEAIKNNVKGTKNLIVSSIENNVEKFVQISTDKAVNPANIMGMTKRVTEFLMKIYSKKTKMCCATVRFGNVLGSHGSVIPLMQTQISKGGPVTVTHPEITRYFMTIPEAAQLVLQAGSLGENGTTYVLDMGKPVKILELAKKLIQINGYEEGKDIQINFIGLRPGEKLYEELILCEEDSKMVETTNARIMEIKQDGLNYVLLENQINELISLAENNDIKAVEKLLEINNNNIYKKVNNSNFTIETEFIKNEQNQKVLQHCLDEIKL